MLPFGVTIPATVPQRSEIPEGLTNYPYFGTFYHILVYNENWNVGIKEFIFYPRRSQTVFKHKQEFWISCKFIRLMNKILRVIKLHISKLIYFPIY